MINGRNRPICSVRSAPNAEPAPPSCCRPATAKPCSSISTRSRPKSSPGRTPLYCLIRPAGMALKPWWFPTTSRSCRCPRAHPSSTVRKTSGSSCVRIGCPTGFSNPSTISSTTAATLGTHSSTNPGKSCPSRDAIGQQSVTESEDWYYIRSDIGPEFVAQAVQDWIAAVGAKTAYIERGSPWENGYIESFNARLRDELLNGEIFYTLREAQIVAESWRRHYNTIRPHASLGYKPPAPKVFIPAFAAWPAALRRPASPATLAQRPALN